MCNFLENWLLNGDVSIRYQVYRDLFSEDRPNLQKRIPEEGWGKLYLSKRRSDGHWGKAFYQPKWTSTHYTLLDLRNLCMPKDHRLILESVNLVADKEKGKDGGINPSATIANSDVCINGMFLNYACWFRIDERKLYSVVDFILSQVMPDGGFNCHSNRSGARHSSLHTTLSVLEGIEEYKRNGYTYCIDDLEEAAKSSREFILIHRLYLSDRTGKIIRPEFLRLPYPTRWKYDILRAMDYFRYSNTAWDDRMRPAVEVLMKKRNKKGTWPLQAHYPGARHIEMEEVGMPSRWNTLRAKRVLKYYKIELTDYIK
jgi:hypothetical protein